MFNVISKYKFYLSFENSIHCKDYVTEKFWRNSLMSGLVPVVFGPHVSDMKALAPPKSYIHVEDFTNPHGKGTSGKTQDDALRDLVKYLNYLNKNNTAYMEYHKWRTTKIDVTTPMETHTRKKICGTCKLLRKKKRDSYPIRMIESVSSWWWTNQHDQRCLNGTLFLPHFMKEFRRPVDMRSNWYDKLRGK